MIIEKKIAELGIVLNAGCAPLANYVTVKQDGKVLYLSGAGPIKNGKPIMQGKLGKDLSVEEGYEAAKLAAINLLSTLKNYLGDLDKVEQISKMFGLVASADDFYQQPAVINGASDLLVAVFGDNGRHARSAVGTNVLPLNLPLEIEIVVAIK